MAQLYYKYGTMQSENLYRQLYTDKTIDQPGEACDEHHHSGLQTAISERTSDTRAGGFLF
ncbi:MAG: hypothetical protein P0Y55_17745 [Candidatus Cohnella colombiensis]|uniref:Uncharacterized protein n=1 Tax=Candidatus Cohnella colombiensis TaxID=3121368 RepID=A0AA95JAH3_9BACL|nr:MAG: hypothetical protein P0Y55_17745 [Cohnella sp.]